MPMEGPHLTKISARAANRATNTISSYSQPCIQLEDALRSINCTIAEPKYQFYAILLACCCLPAAYQPALAMQTGPTDIHSG